jgi:hypothetical protein
MPKPDGDPVWTVNEDSDEGEYERDVEADDELNGAGEEEAYDDSDDDD